MHVYVLDTGIRSTHEEFRQPLPDGAAAALTGSRVSEGFNAVDSSGSVEDCHGHGTHVRPSGEGAGARGQQS